MTLLTNELTLSIQHQPIALLLVGNGANSWLRPQMFVGFMFVGAALCTMGLRAWRIVELEKQGGSGSQGYKSVVGIVSRHLRAAFKIGRV